MRERLRSLVVEQGLLTPERLEECFQEESRTGESIDRILVMKGYMSEIDMLRTFGTLLGMPVLEGLAHEHVPAEFVNQVPVQFARSYNLVAISSDGLGMRVATCSPNSKKRVLKGLNCLRTRFRHGRQ